MVYFEPFRTCRFSDGLAPENKQLHLNPYCLEMRLSMLPKLTSTRNKSVSLRSNMLSTKHKKQSRKQSRIWQMIFLIISRDFSPHTLQFGGCHPNWPSKICLVHDLFKEVWLVISPLVHQISKHRGRSLRTSASKHWRFNMCITCMVLWSCIQI